LPDRPDRQKRSVRPGIGDVSIRDAGLIASAQRLEHYEIAAFGTAAALAGQLDLRDDQRTLHESLEEEKKADLLLTQLAKREVNRDALAA
jgi:ferritin-like metal-binding protein YciE